MRDPVDVDLDRYLTSMEEAEDESYQLEIELFNQRLSYVMNVLNSEDNKMVMARRLVNIIEDCIEESHEQD